MNLIITSTSANDLTGVTIHYRLGGEDKIYQASQKKVAEDLYRQDFVEQVIKDMTLVYVRFKVDDKYVIESVTDYIKQIPKEDLKLFLTNIEYFKIQDAAFNEKKREAFAVSYDRFADKLIHNALNN